MTLLWEAKGGMLRVMFAGEQEQRALKLHVGLELEHMSVAQASGATKTPRQSQANHP